MTRDARPPGGRTPDERRGEAVSSDGAARGSERKRETYRTGHTSFPNGAAHPRHDGDRARRQSPRPAREKIIPGATVVRLLAAADSQMFDLETIARELDGIAQLVGQLDDGTGNDNAGPYFLELALQAIARRVEAMSPRIPSLDRYQVCEAESGR